MIDEKAFDKAAADELKKLEKALTNFDDKVEADLSADILSIEFEDGKKYVVNSHRAARQIWFAANLGAWHFSQDAVSGKWIDTREGRELWAHLEELLGKKLGRAVALKR